jgi:hypothetical protein
MCGGSSAKTDRKETLKSYGELDSVYSTLSDLAPKLTAEGGTNTKRGLQDIDKASKYFSDIMSGDPSKVLAASAPEVNAVVGAGDAAKREQASMGTARGGGVAGENQKIADRNRAATGTIIAEKRGEGARGVAETGREEAGIGLSQTGLGLGAEESAGSVAGTSGSLSSSNRQVSQQIHDASVQQWADLVAGALAGFA